MKAMHACIKLRLACNTKIQHLGEREGKENYKEERERERERDGCHGFHLHV